MTGINTLNLSGELLYQTVVSEQARIIGQLKAGENLINLSEVTRVDSSALAFCLSCMRAAEEKRMKLYFTGFSEELKAIAELVDLDLSLLNYRS